MNPQTLKSFLAVARCSSFTRAAEEVMLTQPAVSRQIGQLERELGVVLFERLGRSVQLTDAGRELCRLAEQLLAQTDRTVEVVRRFGSPDHGRLRIGASMTPGYYLLPPILGRFRRAHPDVRMQFSVENSTAIEQRVLNNDLDLGFVGLKPTSAGLVAEPIADDEVVCFGPPDHPLAGRKRVTTDVLDDETWVVRERGSATRRLFEEWYASQGGALCSTIELHSPEVIKALVRFGVGISFMSIHGLRDDLRRGDLTQMSLAGLRLRRKIYLVRHPDKHLSPVIQRFLQLARPLSASPDPNAGSDSRTCV